MREGGSGQIRPYLPPREPFPDNFEKKTNWDDMFNKVICPETQGSDYSMSLLVRAPLPDGGLGQIGGDLITVVGSQTRM